MKKRYLPLFPEYLQILKMLKPEEVFPVIEAMNNYCLEGKEFNLEEFSPMAQMALLGVKSGLDKSREIQKVRAEAGRKGGAAGKGITKNLGNSNARKHSPNSIANNSKSIATVSKSITNASEEEGEGEVEVEGEDRSVRTDRNLACEASSTKFSFDECLEKALEFRMAYEPMELYRQAVTEIYASMSVDGFLRAGIEDWQRYLLKAINQRRAVGETGIGEEETDESTLGAGGFA